MACAPGGVAVAGGERILAAGGALLSEQAPGTQPSERTLIPRNRLQAAMSRAVIVAQCGIPSGTLHTAKFTVALGRTLAVVAPPPGREGDPTWAGNARLTDPAGCDPAMLVVNPVSRLADQIRERRPLADLILHELSDLQQLR